MKIGTVIWETEEEKGRLFRGFVEKQPGASRNNSDRDVGGRGGNDGRGFDSDGTIRIVETDSTTTTEDEDLNKQDKDHTHNKKKSGPVVRLRVGEYSSGKAEIESSGNHIIQM